MKAIMTVTERAKKRIEDLLRGADANVVALRVGVKTRGCSGMSYAIEYATEQKKFEEVIDLGEKKLFIDPAAVMYLIGSEMDFVEDSMQSSFVFNNPNEKGRCGCGESFTI